MCSMLTEVHSCVVCTCSFYCCVVFHCMNILHFIYPSTHWLDIPIFTMMNNVNICKRVLCGHMFSFLLGRCLGVELLGHVVSLCLLSKRLPNCSWKWLYHFIGSSFFTSSPTLGIVCPFTYGHFSGCVVASHLVLICVTLVSSNVKHLHRRHLSIFFTGSLFKSCLLLIWLPS